MQKDISSLNKPGYKMTKLEKIWWAGVASAGLCIVTFWIAAAAYNNMEAAQVSLAIAGAAAWIAIGALGMHKLRKRHGYYS